MTLDQVLTWVVIICAWCLIRMSRWYEGAKREWVLSAAIGMGTLNLLILLLRMINE